MKEGVDVVGKRVGSELWVWTGALWKDNELCKGGLRLEVGEQMTSYMNVLAWDVSHSWAEHVSYEGL
jgi:hypothetical protein